MPGEAATPLEIHLESSDLVFRGFTGEELEPATLKGELIINLSEATSLKELQCVISSFDHCLGVAELICRIICRRCRLIFTGT